jgi:predicted DCC family thiol-disulfide oxidoreductase YuxK
VAHLVLYDGICGLCDHFVRFLLRIDRRETLRFAALQGEIGSEILRRTNRSADPLSTVLVVVNHGEAGEHILDRSDAALFAIASAGGVFRSANALRIVPRLFRDAAYRLMARWRYRIFGQYHSCPVPEAATRARFLDLKPKTSAV